MSDDDDAPIFTGVSADEIEAWLKRGIAAGASYVIVKADRFSYEYYPVFAFSVRQAIELEKTASDLEKTMEVYDLSLPLDAQLKERRAYHLPDRSRASLEAGEPTSDGQAIERTASDLDETTEVSDLSTALGAQLEDKRAYHLPNSLRVPREADKFESGAIVDTPIKTFLTKQSDAGGERRWHGYPDECYSLTTFADSLVALAYEAVWILQPPIVDLRNAIVVDFASETEAEAESSLEQGWNGAWELPMGAVSTVHHRSETNEQNARIERHMLYIATAMMMGDFHRRVVEKLLDTHTCTDPECSICIQRFSRGLAETFQILADGTEQAAIHLFAKWQPGKALVDRLAQDGIEIRWYHLSEISKPDLEANRYYSIWDGSVAQASEFLETVWAPAWKSRI